MRNVLTGAIVLALAVAAADAIGTGGLRAGAGERAVDGPEAQRRLGVEIPAVSVRERKMEHST